MQLKLITSFFGDKIFIHSVRRCSTKPKWDVYAALCLERRPVIIPEMNIIEKTMYNLCLRYENSRSLLSDHEVRKIRDKERLERIASNQELSSEDLDAASLETAQEFEDKYIKELEKFEFGPRKTKDDEAGNTRTTNRLLDRRLLFFTHVKLGDTFVWTLPMVKCEKQSSLREAIDDMMKNILPDNELQFKLVGNAPLAVHTYKYGKKNQKSLGAIGGKIFILKAFYQAGNLAKESLKNPLVDDFQWLTVAEARKILPSKYWKAVKSSQIIENTEPSIVKASLNMIRKEETSSTGEKTAARSA